MRSARTNVRTFVSFQQSIRRHEVSQSGAGCSFLETNTAKSRAVDKLRPDSKAAEVRNSIIEGLALLDCQIKPKANYTSHLDPVLLSLV